MSQPLHHMMTALVALANGGADMNALENRVYDVLTIAAVADDPRWSRSQWSLGTRQT